MAMVRRGRRRAVVKVDGSGTRDVAGVSLRASAVRVRGRKCGPGIRSQMPRRKVLHPFPVLGSPILDVGLPQNPPRSLSLQDCRRALGLQDQVRVSLFCSSDVNWRMMATITKSNSDQQTTVTRYLYLSPSGLALPAGALAASLRKAPCNTLGLLSVAGKRGWCVNGLTCIVPRHQEFLEFLILD